MNLSMKQKRLLTKVRLVKAMVFPVVMFGYELNYRQSWAPKNWCFWTVVLEKTPKRKSVLNTHWKDWCWSWNSYTLTTWCKELTKWKRPWCWGRLKAEGEGDDRQWDGWMASPTWWTWVGASSGVGDGQMGKPGVLQSTGSQKVRHDWATELNWTERRYQGPCHLRGALKS